MISAASAVTFHGIDGVLFLIAAILFLIAAVLAASEGTKTRFWPVFACAGLLLWVLTNLVH
jgi:hypothetical protein